MNEVIEYFDLHLAPIRAELLLEEDPQIKQQRGLLQKSMQRHPYGSAPFQAIQNMQYELDAAAMQLRADAIFLWCAQQFDDGELPPLTTHAKYQDLHDALQPLILESRELAEKNHHLAQQEVDPALKLFAMGERVSYLNAARSLELAMYERVYLDLVRLHRLQQEESPAPTTDTDHDGA